MYMILKSLIYPGALCVGKTSCVSVFFMSTLRGRRFGACEPMSEGQKERTHNKHIKIMCAEHNKHIKEHKEHKDKV